MTRDEILTQFQIDRGTIRSPGKFEGCPIWAPYFWDRALSGFADEDDGTRYTFEATDDDRELFPELGEAVGVHLAEDENGFVHASTSCPECDPDGAACDACGRKPVWADPKFLTVKLFNTEDDPTQIIAMAEGEHAKDWADYHGSLDGGTWECADGPTFVYDILFWRPGLLDELRAEGFDFDESEYCDPDEHDLAIAKHAAQCAECSGDWRKGEKHMRALGLASD